MKTRLLFALALVLSVAAAAIAIARQERFPHDVHANLFPLCTGCHEGVPAGESARFYPSQQLCAGCHDGSEVRRVAWNGPERKVSNLTFSHPEHAAILEGESELDCSHCHTRAGASRMEVQRAVPDRCFACHGHAAKNHFVDARCQQCHVPLAQTAFNAARVERLPMPPSHQQSNFLEETHGDLARTQRAQCAVCHTRERCAACHVDAATRAEVKAMPAAQAQLTLPAMKARYFLPASHTRPDWIDRHGGPAQNIASCSTCHTRESCTTCHATNAPQPVRALPTRASVTAQGVSASRRAPASHRAPYFMERHGSQAAAKPQTCTSCHTRNECEQCHNATSTGRAQLEKSAQPQSGAQVKSAGTQRSTRGAGAFHPANFMQRHASAAYGRNLECSNCHETTKFCRACHERAGMRTVGRLQPGFHDAQPFWLLNHGKPARQGLESCASCHKQTDCMQCHSQLGSFQISPHGPGFEPNRVQSKNARICSACHLGDPLARTSP